MCWCTGCIRGCRRWCRGRYGRCVRGIWRVGVSRTWVILRFRGGVRGGRCGWCGCRGGGGGGGGIAVFGGGAGDVDDGVAVWGGDGEDAAEDFAGLAAHGAVHGFFAEPDVPADAGLSCGREVGSCAEGGGGAGDVGGVAGGE